MGRVPKTPTKPAPPTHCPCRTYRRARTAPVSRTAAPTLPLSHVPVRTCTRLPVHAYLYLYTPTCTLHTVQPYTYTIYRTV